MDNKLWTYFIYLGQHMWSDAYTPAGRFPAAAGGGAFKNDLITDDKVFRRIIDQLPSFGINAVLVDVGEGLAYQSHPELSIRGSWSHEKLREELAHMREIGLEPFPKLNLSACHDAWLGEYAYMLSTDTYYGVVRDVIEEVAEVFDHPRMFHLGMDEEDYDSHGTGMSTIRCDDLWWHDLYFYFDEVEKHGARPWIWSDYYWNHPTDFEKKMPKECVQSNWYYDPMLPKGANGRYPQKGFQTYVDFARMGYDQIPTSCDWRCRQGLAQTMWLFLEEGIADEHMLGMMAAPWMSNVESLFYGQMNNANRLKYARDMYYEYTPERHREMCDRMEFGLFSEKVI